MVEPEPLNLADLPLLAGQPPEALAALQTALTQRSVKAGKKVFKAGADRDLFIVRRGSVKISLPLHKKDNYQLSTAGRGSLIGAMGFMDAAGHAGNAVALTDTEVYALSRPDFNQLASTHPAIALVLLQAVALNLSNRLHITIVTSVIKNIAISACCIRAAGIFYLNLIPLSLTSLAVAIA